MDNEGYRSEEKKLTTLANTMTDNTMPDSIKRVESLDTETFWKKLILYNLFNSYSNKEFNRLVRVHTKILFFWNLSVITVMYSRQK